MATLGDALVDRRYISQYAIETLELRVLVSGMLADADGAVTAVVQGITTPPGVIVSRAALHPEPGIYQVVLSSAETSEPGLYTVTWTYAVGGVAQTYVGHLEIGESSPAYDNLDEGFKAIVESAWIRFADLFDSPNGGPNLQTYFQTRFNRNRMAQLLQVAVNRLNTIAQPHQTYSLDPTLAPFPYAQWGGLLDQALYIECLKHLIRSYVEQPDAQGVGVARLDRRDYMDRWRTVLDAEERDFRDQMDVFKIANMGLGRSSVLVSGGAYGSYGPMRLPGSPAQPRFWARMY